MTLLKNKTKKIVPAIHGAVYLHNLLPVLSTEVGFFKKEAFILKIITSKLKYIINERGRRSKSRTLARGAGTVVLTLMWPIRDVPLDRVRFFTSLSCKTEHIISCESVNRVLPAQLI